MHASALAETAGLVLRGYAVRASLRERVKELGCLYAISQAAHRHAAAEDGMLRDIAAIIPDGFQFPRRAAARLSVDGRTWRTPYRAGGARRLAAPITVHGARRGEVEVSYPAGVAGPGEDPFLPDERALVDEIALQVGLALERSRDAEERGRLEGQLRHADRLATLGELAAGVAHEINEPLEGILGFAQLARRAPGLPDGRGARPGPGRERDAARPGHRAAPPALRPPGALAPRSGRAERGRTRESRRSSSSAAVPRAWSWGSRSAGARAR